MAFGLVVWPGTKNSGCRNFSFVPLSLPIPSHPRIQLTKGSRRRGIYGACIIAGMYKCESQVRPWVVVRRELIKYKIKYEKALWKLLKYAGCDMKESGAVIALVLWRSWNTMAHWNKRRSRKTNISPWCGVGGDEETDNDLDRTYGT